MLPFAEYEVLFGVVITFGGREISDLTLVRIYRVGIIRIILICSISVCIYSRFINEHHRTFAGTLDGEFHVLGAEGLAVFENILIASIREFERRIYSANLDESFVVVRNRECYTEREIYFGRVGGKGIELKRGNIFCVASGRYHDLNIARAVKSDPCTVFIIVADASVCQLAAVSILIDNIALKCISPFA
ncbi:unknown [Ruminococcus sp. CAG:382]|nr:unknown [Ruminococcus sp. CAG:382]